MAGMIDESTYARLIERMDQLATWLEDEAPYARADQRHLVPHSPEQAYWHLGYQQGLRDVLALLKSQAEGSERTASPSPAGEPDE